MERNNQLDGIFLQHLLILSEETKPTPQVKYALDFRRGRTMRLTSRWRRTQKGSRRGAPHQNARSVDAPYV